MTVSSKAQTNSNTMKKKKYMTPSIQSYDTIMQQAICGQSHGTGEHPPGDGKFLRYNRESDGIQLAPAITGLFDDECTLDDEYEY